MGNLLRLVRDSDRTPPEVDLVDAWRNHMTACGLSSNTVTSRTKAVLYLMAHAGVVDPLELTCDQFSAWLGRPIKAWTRSTYWMGIKRWSEFLREFGYDPGSDLTQGIPRPKNPPPVARPINDAVIDRMLSLKLSGRAHAYVRLALYEALRVHEIAKIRAEDFDFESGWLMVTGKGGVTKADPDSPGDREAGRVDAGLRLLVPIGGQRWRPYFPIGDGDSGYEGKLRKDLQGASEESMDSCPCAEPLVRRRRCSCGDFIS